MLREFKAASLRAMRAAGRATVALLLSLAAGCTQYDLTSDILTGSGPSLLVALSLGLGAVDESGIQGVSEGSATANTYALKLENQPLSDVRIVAQSTDGQLYVNGDSIADGVSSFEIVFTTQNWNQPQTLSITAVDDDLVEGNHTGTITHVVTTDDPDFSAIRDVTIPINDNDSAGTTITPSGGSTAVSEGGGPDSYTIALTKVPSANVSITATVTDGQTTVNGGSSATVTFTPASYNTPQTITVSAADDQVAESNHSGTITHSISSSDPGYAALSVSSVSVGISDNDSASIIVAESGGSTAVTEGNPAPDSFTVVLSSEPSSTATVNIPFDTSQVQLNGSSSSPLALTFNSGNYATPQTVNVTSVDDDIDEPQPHVASLTPIGAAPAEYLGLTGATVNVSITDNDVAGVTLSETGGATNVSEATSGTSDDYTVVLNTRPTATVTVNIVFDNTQVTVNGSSTSPQQLTFNAGNYTTPQLVQVRAVDDSIDETSPHISTITHTASSGDPFYNGVAIGSVNASISDDDTRGVTVTESGGSTDVNETGPTSDVYNVRLNTQPTGNVTISMAFDNSQVTVNGSSTSPQTLIFTTGNWSSDQPVTIQAVNDAAVEGLHVSTITQTASGADYGGTGVANVNANITDNDRTIGGSVTGMTGSGLVLQLNGAETLGVPSNTTFTFATGIEDGNTYGVTVNTQPNGPGEHCAIVNGAGTVSGSNIINVIVECAAFWSLNSGGAGGEVLAVARAGSYVYTAGYDTGGSGGRFRLEKRLATTGALDASFATGGVWTSDPTGGSDQLHAVATDGTFVYVAGHSGGNVYVFKIFVSNGTNSWQGNPVGTNGEAYGIAADANGVYVAGKLRAGGNDRWAIWKLNQVDGSQAWAQTSNPTGNDDVAYAIAVDSGDLYIAGQQNWVFEARIEKRTASTGALDTGFDGDGVVVEINSGDEGYKAIAVDATSIYLSGYGVTCGRFGALVARYNKTTGSRDWYIKHCSSAGNFDTQLYGIAIDSTHVYGSGTDNTGSGNMWRVLKLAKSNGALDTGFGTSGHLLPGYAGIARAVGTDGTAIYIGGANAGDWLHLRRHHVDGGP